MKRSAYRRFMDGLRSALMYIAIAIVCALLVGVIGYIFVRGIPHISWEFLSTKPSPRSGTIGILPDLLNTLYIILMTIVIVLPLGVGAAIYLTEYAKTRSSCASLSSRRRRFPVSRPSSSALSACWCSSSSSACRAA